MNADPAPPSMVPRSPRPPRKEPAIVAAVIVSIIAILLSPFALHWLRDPIAARSEPLPLSFPHLKHRDVSCPVCHHNLKDRNSGLPCIMCHMSDNPKLKRGIEGEFHDFCKGCHAQESRWLKKHGPAHDCLGCHKLTDDNGRLP